MFKKSSVSYLLLLTFVLTAIKGMAQSTIVQYLSGTGSDNTVLWDFYCDKGSKSGSWQKIAVPSNWEQQGFGKYMYGHDKVKADEVGLYKHPFKADKSWTGKKVFIVFQGAMTDTEVKVNGKVVGPIHQGGFYEFKYEITQFLKLGKQNLLEVKVSKHSANESVNDAERDGDFWALGGIYRPVLLEIKPASHIERLAINAKANGELNMEVFTNNGAANSSVIAQLKDLKGNNIGQPFSGQITAQQNVFALSHSFENVKTWNPEQPNLYLVEVQIKQGENTVHVVQQRIGFRTAELRLHDGFYVNGKKVIFKGVNRHNAWPLTGRALNRTLSLQDILLIKEMNMNAVRMSHYPPEPHFLDLCDSLGLFVLDELTGWQGAYDTISGRPLVKEVVVRDVNHVSVVMWANGNEGGWNRALDDDFHKYDIQKRVVYHPWENFRGTDTKHYPDYNYVVNSALYSNEVYFPTEFMHGLYDGGHAAGLDDFWNLMLQHPRGAGGFLWVFADEAIVRMDKDSILDSDGNHAPDGIVGPYREKEASFYAIKEIWSPVHIAQTQLSAGFDGHLPVENRFTYLNLKECSFTWKLAKFPSPYIKTAASQTTQAGRIERPSLEPGTKGFLQVSLPINWQASDVLYVTAFDPKGKEIFTWTWPIHSAAVVAKALLPQLPASKPTLVKQENEWQVSMGGIQYYFNTKNGFLEKVINGQTNVSLGGGPFVSGVKHSLKELKSYQQGEQLVVEPVYTGDTHFKVKWIFESGKPVQLDYAYSVRGNPDVVGICFNYPEEKVTGMKWMGKGPYRVWKNRLKGMQYGVWQKQYNNTITGESFVYPEFKGFHANINWVEIQNSESPFKVFTSNEQLFFQMLKPANPKGAANNNTSPVMAEGNIGFMQAISPIGTKFQPADRLGPQSQKNMQLNYAPITGTLWFDFK